MQAPQVPSILPAGIVHQLQTETEGVPPCSAPREMAGGFGRGKYGQLGASGSSLLQNQEYLLFRFSIKFGTGQGFFLWVATLEGLMSASRQADWKGIRSQPRNRGSLELPTLPASSASQENFHKQLHQD